MADPNKKTGKENAEREPLGFGEHTRRISGERAHEQGWELNEEERRKLPGEKQDYEGGTDYDYGAQDFGDTPVDTSAAKPAAGARKEEEKNRGGESRKTGT